MHWFCLLDMNYNTRVQEVIINLYYGNTVCKDGICDNHSRIKGGINYIAERFFCNIVLKLSSYESEIDCQFFLTQRLVEWIM